MARNHMYQRPEEGGGGDALFAALPLPWLLVPFFSKHFLCFFASHKEGAYFAQKRDGCSRDKTQPGSRGCVGISLMGGSSVSSGGWRGEIERERERPFLSSPFSHSPFRFEGEREKGRRMDRRKRKDFN